MKRFLKIGLLTVAMFAIGRLSAQTDVYATITMNDGSTQNYHLDGNCQIKFGSEDFLWIVRPDNKESVQIALNDIRKITFDDLTGTNENVANTFGIFPNPFHNQFVVKGLVGTSTMSIYAIDGRLVRQCQVENGQVIDLAELNSGLYLVNIGTQNLKMMKL